LSIQRTDKYPFAAYVKHTSTSIDTNSRQILLLLLSDSASMKRQA
jgi:hypothetical protein